MPDLMKPKAQQSFYTLTETQVETVLSQPCRLTGHAEQTQVRPMACGVTLSHLSVLSCSSDRIKQKDLFFGRMWSYWGTKKKKRWNHGLIQANRFIKPKLYLQFYNVSFPFRNAIHFKTLFQSFLLIGIFITV